MSCGITDGDTVKDDVEELSWIKYRDSKGWYLEEYEDSFRDFSSSYKCDEIIQYLEKFIFTCEVEGVVYPHNFSGSYDMDSGWSWKTRK